MSHKLIRQHIRNLGDRSTHVTFGEAKGGRLQKGLDASPRS